MTALVALLAACSAVTLWVFAGYPAFLWVMGRLAPRPRVRAPIEVPVSVIVAAHNEEDAIGAKIENVRRSDYPTGLVEIVVASDGSTDATVERARRAGADLVLDLPRGGKLPALEAGVRASSGDILVFTDADSLFGEETLAELLSNFADGGVGGVTACQRTALRSDDDGLARGEGLYWRYEEWIRRLEDRVGSTVSACGGLYALRRELFEPPRVRTGADDVVISTAVVRAGARLAYDARAQVWLAPPVDEREELRRKVRLMNQGLRAAFSTGPLLLPFRGGLYAIEMVSHKILRRLVPFFLLGALGASSALAVLDPLWWLVLGPQAALYALAAVGAAGRRRAWASRPLFYVPYFFVLGNAAAALAVLSLAAGVRYELWSPVRVEPNL